MLNFREFVIVFQFMV